MSKQNLKRVFWDISAYNGKECYSNPEDPNSRLSPRMIQRMKESFGSAAVASEKDKHKSTPSVELAGAIIEGKAIDDEGISKTIADSNATSHCSPQLE